MANEPEPDVRRRLATAEFRAAAAGRIGNADTVAELLDPDKLLDPDGNVDPVKVSELVDAMAASAAPAAPTRPAPFGWAAGVRQPAPRSDDWLRDEFPSHVHL